MDATHQDWTAGEPALRYNHCPACDKRWLFSRDFCPRCGMPPEVLRATGSGVAVAVTGVMRAPNADWEAHVPYTVVLVDLREGVRMLAHGQAGLSVGDAVQSDFQNLNGRLLPFFRRVPG